MLFSVSYLSKTKQKADEIKCPYNQLGVIWGFIKEYPDKRINIVAVSVDEEDLDRLFREVDTVKSAVDDNYTVTCGDFSLLQTMLTKGYNACFKFPVTDWEGFGVLKSLGVSDIYIDGPLGFQTDRLIQAKGGIKIRVSPSLSPNAAPSASPNLNSFFIRPEDLDKYSEIIDVIDFMESDLDRESTLLDIYRRRSFPYNLALLIPNLNIQVENIFIHDSFAANRLNCGQKCKIPGYSCHICENETRVTNQLLQYFGKYRPN